MVKLKNCEKVISSKMFSDCEDLFVWCKVLNIYVNDNICWLGCPYYKDRWEYDFGDEL